MDARLFSMSPKEIEQLDPQHRLVMLCSYEALERAGYSSEPNSPSSFDGKRIAVCMAASWDDYPRERKLEHRELLHHGQHSRLHPGPRVVLAEV